MSDSNVPPGWGHNPSRWSKRIPIILIAAFACGVATYLTLYQVNVLAHVWEPFFGNGSKHILKESLIARVLPIPDSCLGALGYVAEFLLESYGGESRWRTRPWVVLLLGLTAAGMAVVSIFLICAQAFWFHAFCTLCLVSAFCSILVAFLVRKEVWAGVQFLRRETAQGHSFWRVLWGRDAPLQA